MSSNIGSFDRFIRLLLAGALFYAGLFLYSSTTLGWVLVGAGGLMVFSALVGFCGLYRLLGISTKQVN
jgi:hypothetical protein